MMQNLLSAAVLIGALKVKDIQCGYIASWRRAYNLCIRKGQLQVGAFTQYHYFDAISHKVLWKNLYIVKTCI